MWQAIAVKKSQKNLTPLSSSLCPEETDDVIISSLPPLSDACPLLLSSPHSGRCYRADFLEMSSLSRAQLERMEDRFVDQLIEGAPSHGISLLHALFPRSFCDVNRDWRELDGAMFLPPVTHPHLIRSDKVISGYGVIPRCVSPQERIYLHCLPYEEAEKRLSHYWGLYHQQLKHSQEVLTTHFGFSLLLDVHSMPPLPQQRPCDIVLGDRHQSSCSPLITAFVAERFSHLGYCVQHNTPYAGGYITHHYGSPSQQKHALQLELNRSLYLNLATLKPSRHFTQLKHDLTSVLKDVAHWLQSEGGTILTPPT